ncbi:MAG: hypothetical protein LBR98_08165 [Syntrophomonadaceae bacterium]|nr:hypothetical protein [Syntrophomonadaceae bacterium]
MKKKKIILITAALVAAVFLASGLSGCQDGWKIFRDQDANEPQKLIYVDVCFSENEHLTGYVHTLGIEPEVKILAGGASINNLYNKQGEIIASFNYLRVNYIKIIPEPNDESN